MKIEFTIEEYFNQLKLMEQQCGLEEDLYPWIYMILQMSECKKRELLKNEYKEVSIRDVHNRKESILDNVIEPKRSILYKLSEKRGVPDFVILVPGKETFLGCVEIKEANKQQLIKNLIQEEYIINLNEEEFFSIKYNLGINTEEINNRLQLLQKLQEKSNIKILNVYPGRQCNQGYTLCTIEASENITEILGEELSKNIICVNKSWRANIGESSLGWLEEQQILSHLVKYRKVLYTNGKEFYYLSMEHTENEQTKIKIELIADFRKYYECFKKEANTKKWILKASAEWDKLISGLYRIDWYEGIMTN